MAFYQIRFTKTLNLKKLKAAGIATMTRPDLDRNNFSYLPRFWDAIGSRPLYRVTMALN